MNHCAVNPGFSMGNPGFLQPCISRESQKKISLQRPVSRISALHLSRKHGQAQKSLQDLASVIPK